MWISIQGNDVFHVDASGIDLVTLKNLGMCLTFFISKQISKQQAFLMLWDGYHDK